MQQKARGAVLALMMAGLLVAPIAEAKRAGGGKSSGMSRTQTSSQSAPQQNNMNRTQAAPTTPTQAAPQKSGSNVGGMVAAGVAGAAIGAVAMNAMADDDTAANPEAAANAENAQAQAAEQEESSSMGWLWILILAAIAFFVFRKFKAKKSEATNPYAPNSAGAGRPNPQAPFGQPAAPTGSNTNIFGQQVGGNAPTAPVGGFGGAYTNSGNQLPDGTEPATFLRFARQRFNHIQAMNTASNIEEIRRYFTPDMYQAIYNDISSNQDVAEFSNLLANVVEQTTENGQYIVSVRFTGMVSEDINSPSQPFSETWHFVKPEGSQEEWVVAGIQQN